MIAVSKLPDDPLPYVHPNGRDRYSVAIRLDGVWTEYKPRDWFEFSTWEQKAMRFAEIIDAAWATFVPQADEAPSASAARRILAAAGPETRGLGIPTSPNVGKGDRS